MPSELVLELRRDHAPAFLCAICTVVQVPAGETSTAAEAVNAQSQALAQEYGALEKQLDVSVGQSERRPPDQVLTPDSADQLLTLLLTLPHGVVKYSHTVPGDSLGHKLLSPVLLLLSMAQM